MPTRIDWLPYGIAERNMAIKRIASQIDEYGPKVGFSQQEIDRVKEISVQYDFAATIYDRNSNQKKALRTWRDSMISSSRIGKAAGERPMFDNTPAPAGMRTGLIGEIRKFVEMIKASPGYTTGIGVAMGILSPNHVKKSLHELQPEPKVTAVLGYRVKIVCEKQGMDAIQVEYCRNGEETWQKVAFLISLPETIYIAPAVIGVPETGRIRVIYIKKNKTVGQYSNMQYVTLFAS